MLQLFTFESKEVRFVGTADKPEWIAQDVCNCLDLANVSQALDSLDEDEKGITIIDTLGGEQRLLTVTEPGLYSLTFKSRKAPAKRFKRWIFHDVLPSIRKTGSYSVSQQPIQQSSVKEEIDILKDCLFIAGLDPKLIAGIALNHAGTRIPELKEAVQEGHELLAASGQTELLLTPTKIGKELGISNRKVNEILVTYSYTDLSTGTV
jgi:prophage antirepressor-like protein